MTQSFCTFTDAALFNLLDLSRAPAFLYGLYGVLLLATVFFAITVWGRRKEDGLAKSLAILLAALAVHMFFLFVSWLATPIALIMFSWQIWPLTFALLFFALFSFLYQLFQNKSLPPTIYFSFLLLLVPIALLLPTNLNISAVDTTSCIGLPAGFLLSYTFFYAIITIFAILILGYFTFKKSPKLTKRNINSIVTVTFFVLFALLLTSYAKNLTGFYNYELICLEVISVLLFIVQHKLIRPIKPDPQIVKIVIMGVALIIMAGSVAFSLPVGTLLATIVLGLLFYYSTRKEIKHTEEIEDLATKLRQANVRLKALDKQKSEFVSIASHQLRTPLTSIRGHSTLLLEGSYGRLTKKVKEPIERIAETTRLMSLAIEDYLSVSRIESGHMNYDFVDFNLRDEVDHICDDLRRDAIKKGLGLIFRSNLDNSRGIINADLGKTVQIVQNMINNAIKYTEKGNIKIWVRDDIKRKKIYVDVVDTGIGMSKDSIHKIFQKFERAGNAHSIDIHGTGLGLYVALKMAEEMGGTITAQSEGEGKGSQFTLALPLAL